MKQIRIFLVVVLILVTAVVGCGKEDEGVKLPIGILADFSGPGVFAVKPMVDGFIDVLRMSNEDGTVPGLTFSWVTYDQKSDASRVPGGYMWLKGRGAEVMMIMSPTDRNILAHRIETDEVLVLGTGLDEQFPNHPWSYNIYGDFSHDAEAAMAYVMETWDYEGTGRSPRFAVIGDARFTATNVRTGAERMYEWYPDKFEWVKAEHAPTGTTTWAAEILRVKDADFILPALSGPMLASLIREARARGYEGSFVAANNQFGGFFGLVKAAVSPEQLYGMYQVNWLPLWDDEVDLINTVKQQADRFQPGKLDGLMENTGYIHGVLVGMLLLDAVSRAADDVGVTDLNADTIRSALKTTDLHIWGEQRWSFAEDYHSLIRCMKAYAWNVATGKWEDAKGVGWITPHSLDN